MGHDGGMVVVLMVLATWIVVSVPAAFAMGALMRDHVPAGRRVSQLVGLDATWSIDQLAR
jgi:hypothetical protein